MARPTPLTGKRELRLNWRKNFPYSPQERTELSLKMVGFLKVDSRLQKASLIGVFSPLPWEPDLLELINHWPSKLAFPRVTSPTSMAFHKVDAVSELKAGYGGILEPAVSAAPVTVWQPHDILLVPGYGFDIFGGRVGSGKGFYDRFLASFTGISLGIAFESQVSQLPLDQEAFDARMTLLCTDRGIRACKSK